MLGGGDCWKALSMSPYVVTYDSTAQSAKKSRIHARATQLAYVFVRPRSHRAARLDPSRHKREFSLTVHLDYACPLSPEQVCLARFLFGLGIAFPIAFAAQ